MRVRLSPVDKRSATHAMLVEYMANTHAPTHDGYTLELLQVLTDYYSYYEIFIIF